MERKKIPNIEIVNTQDGTSTIYNPDLQEHYHSIFGSYTESEHIFIHAGLNFLDKEKLVVFEVGFGSGLNAFLTLIDAIDSSREVKYYAIEKYPVPQEIYEKFVLPRHLIDYRHYFITLHQYPWNEPVKITDNFEITKIKGDWTKYKMDLSPDLVYYDAFSYDKQPQMWAADRFRMLYEMMPGGGVIITYTAKGVVKQNMREAGFDVKRLPGPRGKRHIVRAIKKQ